MRLLLAVLVLAGANCDVARDQSVSAEQAKNSMCVHLMGVAAVGATAAQEPDLQPLIDALELDRRLLNDAGNGTTAETVDAAIKSLQELGVQPVEVSVFLRSDVRRADVDALDDFLGAEPGVARYEYISVQEAYDEFVKEYEDQPEFYEDLPADALPASFRIETTQGTDSDELVGMLQEREGVDDVRSGAGALSGMADTIRPLLDLCEMRLPGDTPDEL